MGAFCSYVKSVATLKQTLTADWVQELWLQHEILSLLILGEFDCIEWYLESYQIMLLNGATRVLPEIIDQYVREEREEDSPECV